MRTLRLAQAYTIYGTGMPKEAQIGDLFISPGGYWPQVIRKAVPSAYIGHYIFGFESIRMPFGQGDHYHDYYPYAQTRAARPDWYLHAPNGRDLIRKWGTRWVEYSMDYGNPECRDHVIHRLRDDLAVRGRTLGYPNFVFIDNLSKPLNWTSIQYPAATSRANLTREWLAQARSAVRSVRNTEMYANIFQGGAVYDSALNELDGYMLEGFVFSAYQDANDPFPGYLAPNLVDWQLETVSNPSRGKAIVVTRHSYRKDLYYYTMAAVYLVANPHVYACLWDDRQRPVIDNELFLDFGQAIDPVAVRTSGLWMRRYANALVLLNPYATTAVIAADRRYRSWNNEYIAQGSPIKLPPRSGMLYWAE